MSTPMDESARDFLSQNRIAVAGVSRQKQDAANIIYDKLKSTGHTVFAVNPNTPEFQGEQCYPDIVSIPGGVEGVVAVTRPEVTEQIVDQCIQTGVRRIWMHRSIGNSVSETAVSKCKKHGIRVIAGGCPMMFLQPVDIGHKCMKWWFNLTGKLPHGDYTSAGDSRE